MKKKTLNSFITIITIICGIFAVSFADSGWDYSYDSGSSWDSSWDSDWDYSYDSGSSWDSSWDSDDNWDDSYSGDMSLGGMLIVACSIVLIFIICFICFGIHHTDKKYSYRSDIEPYDKIKNKNKIRAISYEKLIQYPKVYRSNFLQEAYDNYVAIQTAWSNFDYEKLSQLTTNELYNTYKMQLETLQFKNQRNIMDNFEKHYLVINDINEVNGVLSVDVGLGVTQKDYVIDNTSHKLLRGNSSRLCNVFYKLTFVCSNNKEQTVLECPNCGASINNIKSYKCEYCHSNLVGLSDEKWLLAKKEIIH